MASLNKVVLLGNITRDPEIRKSASGVTIARLRLAVNELARDRATGQTKEIACYVDVTVWDRQADACGQYLQKGSQILVDGRLVYDEWKTPQGESRSRLSVRADRVQFLNGTKRLEGGQQTAPQQPQGGQPPSAASQSASAPQPAPPPASPLSEDDENLPF